MTGTILEECWKPSFARTILPGRQALEKDLKHYPRYYNSDRAHPGRWAQGRTPSQVIGANKMYPGR